jgi:hypothetical protein
MRESAMGVRKFARHLFFVGVLIGLAGCLGTEYGQKQISDPARVSQIQKGVTTKGDITAAFGEAEGKSFLENGDEEWTYSYLNSSSSPLNFVPVVGMVAGGATVQSSSLTVTFDKRGIVKAYAVHDATISGR